ncbi:MAG TPA: hypothetical protein VGG30_09610, partial [Pirellulales bacterium]
LLAAAGPQIAAADDTPKADAAKPAAAVFKAGFAERDITPAVGAEQPGGYGKSFNRLIHDPCKARAAVFDDGTHAVALVGIDALFIRHPSVAAARKQIHERCGIPEANIMIGASHSHSAGPMGMTLPGEYDHADEFVRKLAYEMSSMADAEYLRKVETAIADAVCDAHEHRTAARCAAGFGLAEGIAFNRRFRMKSGLSVTHPRAGNPEIVEPAGPVDPQVGVLSAWDSDGKFLGCVVNFACHATTGPGGVSADYIGYAEKTIRGLMGEHAGFVFLNGMSGDITQVNNASPYKLKEFGEISARFIGGSVGAEALKVLLAGEQSAGAEMPVAAVSKTLKIKRRVPSAARSARSRELAEKDPKTVDGTEWTFAKEILLLNARLQKEPVADVELQAVQVGPAVFCSCPAEYFCQYGLDIKAGSPFKFTFPVSLANDCVGYVPTEEALGRRGGGYETRLTGYSNLEPTAGRQMADALIELARSLKPGPTPQPPALPPFADKAWTYGDVPPELD